MQITKEHDGKEVEFYYMGVKLKRLLHSTVNLFIIYLDGPVKLILEDGSEHAQNSAGIFGLRLVEGS